MHKCVALKKPTEGLLPQEPTHKNTLDRP